MSLTVWDIANKVDARLVGDGRAIIHSVAPLHSARPDSISFLASLNYRRHLLSTQAGAVILGAEFLAQCPVPALVSGNPYATFARVAQLLHPPPSVASGIHPTAVVAADASVDTTASVAATAVIESGSEIGPRCQIASGVFIGKRVILGPDCRLLQGVTLLDDTELGARVVIQPGAVLGSDGFGYANDQGRWLKIPQLGRVVIGDDVEIGANTTIDRGALEDTVIGDGVIIDNQVQIAHNVRIGAHTAIAGCVGIAGSVVIGRGCTLAGGVGIAGHLKITDDVHITGMSMVTKSLIEPGRYSSGMPLQPNSQWRKNAIRFRKLDEIAHRLSLLERKIDAGKT